MLCGLVGGPSGLEGLTVDLDHVRLAGRETLEDCLEQHARRERQVVGHGAEHHRVAEAHVAEFQRDGHGIATTVVDRCGATMQRYRIEIGRNQGVLPKEIVGAIANEGGIEGKLIGQINLFDDYSTVELPELPPEVLDILKRTRVRQLPLKIRVAEAGEGETRRPAKPRWDKEREPSREVRERRPASADFSAKPPYRGDKKPAGEWQGRGAGSGGSKPAGKPPAKKRPY